MLQKKIQLLYVCIDEFKTVALAEFSTISSRPFSVICNQRSRINNCKITRQTVFLIPPTRQLNLVCRESSPLNRIKCDGKKERVDGDKTVDDFCQLPGHCRSLPLPAQPSITHE